MKLIVKNARLIGEPDLKDIAVEDDRIVKVGNNIRGGAEQVLDAKGRLTSPCFVDAHMHLDKALLAEGMKMPKTIEDAIALMKNKKEDYSIADIKRRASRVLETALRNGTTVLRTNVDVDPVVKLKGIKAMIELKKEYSELIDIQVVAFPQEGIIKAAGTEKLLRQAMKLGADTIGGHTDSDPNPKGHIDLVFEIANEFHSDIDMHVDEQEDPKSVNLEYYAEKAISEKYQGKVTAAHCFSLALIDNARAKDILRKVKKADMNIVITRAFTPLTRVSELIDSGVNVSYASDNVRDVFNPLGNADMLQIALLMANAGRYIPYTDVLTNFETLFEMATVNPARTLGIMEHYGIQPGKKADLVILDATSPEEAIVTQAKRLYVIKNGRIVVENGMLFGGEGSSR